MYFSRDDIYLSELKKKKKKMTVNTQKEIVTKEA